jgi:hypothetical protein
VFFIEFLKTAGLWDAFVKDCPLCWKTRGTHHVLVSVCRRA